MKCLLSCLILLSLLGCVPRAQNSAAQAGLCPEVSTVETRKPALISMLIKVKTCQGTPLTDVTIANFTILENDESISASESRPDIFPSEQTFQAITLLLLDISASVVNSGGLAELKDAAQGFVTSLFGSSVASKLAIYWFDGSAEIFPLSHFSSDQAELLNSIERLTDSTASDDSTNLHGAIVSGLKLLEQEEQELKTRGLSFVLSSLVIFTDGTDRASRVDEAIALEAIQNASATTLVQTVGLGSEISENKLRQLGRDGFEYASKAEQIQEAFERAAERISRESKSYYLLRYCSPRRAGSHQLTVQLRLGNQTGAFRQAFSAEGFEAGCDPKDATGLVLARTIPVANKAVSETLKTPMSSEGAYDVVCVRNETPWDIIYTNRWGEDATWYEATLKPGASNVHPWPLAVTEPSPGFFVRFDRDFSSALDYQEYALSKRVSNEQSCKNVPVYVFRQLDKQQQIDLFVLN